MRGNPWAILLTLSLGFFMTLLDLTIVNIAIPSMTDSLNASLDEILWVVNAYAIALAVLLITAGRMGDLRGPRSMFAIGVALFTLASAACAFSQSPAQLIAARVIQGIGAAILMPQTMTLIVATFPANRRGTALGIWGAVAGVATVAGPTLGGLLVTWFDWRWIFLINLPIGAAVLFLTYALIPDARPGRRKPLDLPGVLIASIGLVLLTFGLVEGQRYDWGSVWGFVSIPLLIVTGIGVLIVFVAMQAKRQDRQPLLPLVLFRDRDFTLMTGVGAIVNFSLVAVFLPLTIYLQSALDYSALRAGLTLAPLSLVSMCVAPVAGRLADRIGGKFILITGLTLYALGMTHIAFIAGVDSRWYDFLPGLLVAGVGTGSIFAPMNAMAMHRVQPAMAGAASGVFNTTRQLGSAIGGAAVGALLQNRLAQSLPDEADKRSGELGTAREPFIENFRRAASDGLEIGPGQSEGFRAPAGTPAATVDEISEMARQVFAHGLTSVLRPTLALPIIVTLVGAALCFAVRRTERAPAEEAEPVYSGSS